LDVHRANTACTHPTACLCGSWMEQRSL